MPTVICRLFLVVRALWLVGSLQNCVMNFTPEGGGRGCFSAISAEMARRVNREGGGPRIGALEILHEQAARKKYSGTGGPQA